MTASTTQTVSTIGNLQGETLTPAIVVTSPTSLHLTQTGFQGASMASGVQSAALTVLEGGED